MILGACLIEHTSPRVDREQHGDLTFAVGDQLVGFRIQKHEYLRYGDHFTIREHSQNGMETEWKRMFEGEGPDLFLGAFAHEAKERKIGRWLLIDVDAFVSHDDKSIPRKNGDGSTFRRIQIARYDPIIVRKSGWGLMLDPPRRERRLWLPVGKGEQPDLFA